MSFPLDDSGPIFDVSLIDVQIFSCESGDPISLIGKISLIGSFDAEPTTWMLAGIGNRICSIIVFIVEDAEGSIGGLLDKCEFVVLWHDDKTLGAVTGVGADYEFVVRDCQGFGWVHDGNYAVLCIGL